MENKYYTSAGDNNNDFIDGFIISEDENQSKTLLFGRFPLGADSYWLKHFYVNLDEVIFYVLTDERRIRELESNPDKLTIKETFDLCDLDAAEQDYYLFEDETRQIYKILFYSLYPYFEPQEDTIKV